MRVSFIGLTLVFLIPSHRYGAAFRERGLNAADHDYDMCIVLKSTGDIASWVEADCYETKGYICKIKG